MEKLTPRRKKMALVGAIMMGSALLTACSSDPVDYEGTGNEFVVRGIVSDSEEDGLIQIHEPDLVAIEATGKAATWFAKGKGQEAFGDEFDFLQKYSQEPGGWLSCGSDVYVGIVYNMYGDQIQPQEVPQGAVVEIAGKIRESMYYQSTGKSGHCTDEDLAVYDTVRVMSSPTPVG